MKLNYKQTFFVGLAFMSICAFWQMYDNIIPLILDHTFHMGETVTGVIMALDNVLALFLLPVFGSLSDRVNTRLGKRTPFIVVNRVSRGVYAADSGGGSPGKPDFVFGCVRLRAAFYELLPLSGSGVDAGSDAETITK